MLLTPLETFCHLHVDKITRPTGHPCHPKRLPYYGCVQPVPSPVLFFRRALRLLLGRGLGLGRLLPVTPDHDDAEERSDHGRAHEDEDDGDSNGPYPRREEVLERVVVIDEGLKVAWRLERSRAGRSGGQQRTARRASLNSTDHEKGPDCVVEEHDGSSHEHGEAD